MYNSNQHKGLTGLAWGNFYLITVYIIKKVLENFAKAFFQFEKRWKILQKHFFSLKNAGKFCKSIFSV
ncbi:MAG: hypothetical protein II287_09385 [Bacteroidaceae bacterium]|nr:hypothetical protein [Bacteroidaceae bacterium]